MNPLNKINAIFLALRNNTLFGSSFLWTAVLSCVFWHANVAADDQLPNQERVKTTQCPSYLNHEYRKLHSTDMVNLCDLYSDKAMLFVNTASHCGFTKQFGPLESLHKKYQKEGLVIIGFTSDDFRQAAKDEEKAASVCYKNYGVTFTMLAPTKVRGEGANPTFAYLGDKTKIPSWNFNKYLVSSGEVTKFGSRTNPLDSEIETAIKAALDSRPET